MKTILIIEDNSDIRENIAEILELADFEPLQAANGKEGVEIAMEQKPDLIICDIMMPELDGYGVLHILSRKEDTASIPFIFLTAKAERADMRKGMSLGADDYLTKPFEDTELLEAINIRLKKADALKKDYSQDERGLNEFIEDVKAVHGMEQLHETKKPRLYKKKHDIFHEGEIPNHLYFVVNGKVKTYKTNEEGKELLTAIYVDGEFFGYESLLKNSEYTDSASAIENSQIISIPKSEFFELLFGNREVSKRFIELLSKKVIEKEEKLLNLAYNSVRQRTAEALIDVYEKFNPDEENTNELAVSREDLANMVGTATESVIRVISDFKEAKIIETNAGKILVRDLKKLQHIEKWHNLR